MAETDYLEGALQQLLAERADLDVAIAALQKRVGKKGASGESTLSDQMTAGPSNVSATVYRGDFFNLSITKAAEKLLKRVGRALKTSEIQAAFEKAGYEIKSKSVRPTIYTSLNRSKDFVKVLPDTWDLAARHPEAAEQKLQELSGARTKKAKKSGKKPKTAKAELKPEVVEDQKVA